MVSTEEFPDHYFYKQKDIAKLEAKAREAQTDILLTTAKDAAKLNELKFDLSCFVVESKMVFDGENDFRDWITLKINASK